MVFRYLLDQGQAEPHSFVLAAGARVDLAEAFEDADIVYPKSWAPFNAMEKRTQLYGENDTDGIKSLERELLAQNAEFKDWECTEELMAKM